MAHSRPDDGRRTPAELPTEEGHLESVLVPHADGPSELTLFPADAADETLVTHWITAREGAYVSLDDWR